MNLCLVIKLKGGLGNQLFQYATGRQLTIDNKIPFLFFNIDEYINESLGRTFCLGHLNIKGSVIRNNHLKNIFKRHTKLNFLMSKLGLHKNIYENGFTLQDIKNRAGIFTSLNGYWQSPLYFKEIRALLIKELVPKQIPAYPKWLENNNTVAIHVRRKDYLLESRYGFIGMSYYKNAIDFMKCHLVKPIFIIFSDDMDWCKNEFDEYNFLFCEEQNWQEDYLQLHLMSKCNNQIIANSSFSWWGAWLNSNVEKLVIRPTVPFTDNSLLYESHYPAEWIALDN